MIEILRARRSIRKYEARNIDEETLNILKEAVLRCPSSRGINPWTFIFIDNRELLQRLSQSKEHGANFIKDAALGVVICGDETKTDVWIEDCSIASIVLQLTAHSLGLGTCWIQIRNRLHSQERTSEKFIQELLHIPEYLRVECVVSIGYPAEIKKPLPFEKLDFKKIKHNGYL